jgi:hypothetical protein
MKRFLLSIGLSLVFLGTSFGQSQIAIEDFEDGTIIYTTSVSEFSDNSYDFFTRTDGTNIGGNYSVSNIQGSSYFAAQDIDGEGATLPVTLILDDINISGYSSLEFRVYLAEDDDGSSQDWDAADYVHFDYDIDNSGSFENLLHIEADISSGSNGKPLLDTDFDGLGDGAEITSSFVQFTQSISGTGSALDVKVTLSLDSGDEDIAFDNIEIYGTAAGGTSTKLAVTEINGGSSPSVGTEFDIVVELQDADDNATAATSDTTVTLSLGSGSGSLGGTLTGTIDSASTSVTFTGITYSVAESFTITATNTGGSLTAGTSSSVTALAAADQLVLVSVPTEGNSGASLDSFTVEARRSGDSSVDLNYTKSISLSIASGTGSIGGTTSKSASSGVATFDDITIDSGGDFTLEATDGSLTSSASGTITITEINIVLNEFLADPGVGFDPNGDGTTSTTNDEFVEFVNTGTSDLDISGWTIEDGFGTRHTFSESTILKPKQAVVVFGGGSLNGEFGDALAYIASDGPLGLNNGGDTITLKDSEGSTIVTYSYGSEGGNDVAITRSPDLTGAFTSHSTADTDDGSDFSPGTKLDGTTFQPSVSITGAEGWRMLSTPTSNNSYDDLLGDLWTQGIGTGADVTNGTANVQLFNTSTDNFAAVTDLTATMTAGTGFITYVYSDDDYDGSAEGFPKLVSAFGTENSGTVTPTLNDGADAWTLVGNPYASTIDWDLVGKTEVTGTVYVYDHSYGTPAGDDVAASGSAGSYRVWNGTTGSLTDGLITPFQGFWVQNASSVSSPELSIEEADKSTGGTFYKQAAPAAFALKAEMADMMNDTYFSFTQQGALGRDNFDGYELAPLDFANYMSVSTAVDGESFDINNLPISLDEAVEIPLQIAAYEANIEAQSWTPMSGEVTLSWPTMSAIPQGWSIQLKDYDTGASVDLLAESAYSFELKASASKAKARSVNSVINPMVATKEKTTTSSRFAIMIAPTTSVANETEDSPAAFALEQNYPNPFNPSTTISYSVQEAGAVSISVYNLMGQKVATLVDETKAAGQYNVRWNAAGAASGMYYYRLEAGGQSITRKMTLIK